LARKNLVNVADAVENKKLHQLGGMPELLLASVVKLPHLFKHDEGDGLGTRHTVLPISKKMWKISRSEETTSAPERMMK
jgi:hypothetical protein